MRTHPGQGPPGNRRRAAVSSRDALVFVVIALVALCLVEGLILVNSSPGFGSTDSTVTVTMTSTGGGGPATSVSTTTSTKTLTETLVSNSTNTVTSDSTSTTTHTSTTTDTDNVTLYVTLTQTSDSTSTQTATSTVTSTVTSDSTSTITKTVTSTVTSSATSSTSTSSQGTTTTTSSADPVNSYVEIMPGDTANSSAYFSPQSVTVVIGNNNTVAWINYDEVDHTVSCNTLAESFQSGEISPGGMFTFTFTTVGTYQIALGPGSATGTVVVKS